MIYPVHRLKLFFEKIGLEKFLILIKENNHSPAMIYDLLVRDYGLNKEDISLRVVRDFLNKFVKYDSLNTSSQPQWFKLQYKYPKSFSKEDILSDINKKARQGQKKLFLLENQKVSQY